MLALRKLVMASPFIFAHLLLQAGHNALFVKQDMSDAYKLVQTNPQFVHYFGFKWLGIFFYELATVFGNCATPLHFDFAETIIQLAITMNKIPAGGHYVSWMTL
jgi:hypothetical protein